MQMRSTRDGFGEQIELLGKRDARIFVVDADIGKSCKTTAFQHSCPAQHINVGIAEQNAAGVAAGLATCGKIPFVVTYAAFGSMRMCEQVRQMICYPNLNVKLACSHGGVTPANDGATHQCIEDYGIMCTIPNMRVVMPADYVAAKKLVEAAAQIYGPVYLRFTRDEVPVIYDESQEFTIGKAVYLRRGDDVALIANGDTVCLALEAADALRAQGVEATVLDMHTVKPLDDEAVKDCIRRCGAIVTVEDHNVINGMGSAVASVVAQEGGAKMRILGVQDRFGMSAPYARLLEMNGITAAQITQSAMQLYREKNEG